MPTPALSSQPPQRLAKWIAHCGHCSRRAAERLITQQRVKVNAELASHTMLVSLGDNITIDDIPLAPPGAAVYLLYHKPVGIDCNIRPQDPASLYQILQQFEQRLFAVGRLDKDSSGLLLLTNDGQLSQRLMHPDYFHEKTYRVGTDKALTAAFISQMAQGVSWQLGDNRYQSRPCKVVPHNSHEFDITLTQGLHRQIRYMCKSLGYKVTALKRTHLTPIALADLPCGAWRELTAAELTQLQALSLTPQPQAKQ